jgi:hypothetical protein
MDSMARSTSASTRSSTRTSRARARSSSPSTRCRWTARRSTRRRTPTSRCSCTGRCGRSSSREPAAAPAVRGDRAAAGAVLQRMERTGVLVDGDELRVQSRRWRSACRSSRRAAHHRRRGVQPRLAEAAAGRSCSSGWAAGHRKTPTGQPSTARTCSRNSPRLRAAALILEYRGLAKLKSTYTDKLPEQINPARDGSTRPTTRPSRRPAGCRRRTRTCRTSRSARPRAGASARRSSRRPATSDAADYSQIELRIMAHLSGRRWPARARSRRPGHSPGHRRGDVRRRSGRGDADQRRSAKAINFGLIYGMSAFGLARAARRRARRGAGLHRPLLRALPGREALHGQTRALARERATSRPCSGAGCTCRTSARATGSCSSTPSAARSTRPCRARPRTSSSAR